ncbi:MAG: 4Fe-4S dicluster domain-containing protein, partial [Actinomycetota bacterium]|nr:4Fe-4S dicluster domain-containing protein [Actinomycetota bacterium]
MSEGAFDDHRPPDAGVISDCVHCGFCLPACPTYALWGEEMDSPRGRIHLMAQGLDGEPMTDSMVGHIDACLGCMACVTACPSGVAYDKLITATRAQVERRHTRSRSERALRAGIFAVFP